MNIRFTSPTDHPQHTVFHLLKQVWAPLSNPKLEENIRLFDSDVTDHPHTVGACTFVTCSGSEPVGMASYDPRQRPERGLIGWNGVVPEYRREGIGRAQIQEIIRIFQSRGIQNACVITSHEEFFVPAQRMYEACGFVKVRDTEDGNIEYELGL